MKWGVPQTAKYQDAGNFPGRPSLGVIALRLGAAGIPTTGSYTSAAGYDGFKANAAAIVLGGGMYGWRLRLWGLKCSG
ncbi:hypothetical protein V499_07201 [Pseudogymnoascus sp. VKM F-103]|nr:hypothetical protein V499_07201 [Pseudogymnoascus sp. VKM F-103]